MPSSLLKLEGISACERCSKSNVLHHAFAEEPGVTVRFEIEAEPEAGALGGAVRVAADEVGIAAERARMPGSINR